MKIGFDSAFATIDCLKVVAKLTEPLRFVEWLIRREFRIIFALLQKVHRKLVTISAFLPRGTDDIFRNHWGEYVMDSDLLKWKSNTEFEIGGYVISMDYEHGGSKIISEGNKFLLMKARNFLDHYTSLAPEEYKKVLELGVYQGGSFVFLDKLLKPDRLSAIELSTTPIPALDKYVSENEERTRLYYGTSQDDAEKLREIVRRDFDGQLDLVVDDASHFYEQTKASFMTLFPLVRPGGMYIIEDWGWSFQDDFQSPNHAWYPVASPANLIIDLMEDMTRSGLILDVQVARELLKIRRSNVVEGPLMATQARRGRTLNLL